MILVQEIFHLPPGHGLNVKSYNAHLIKGTAMAPGNVTKIGIKLQEIKNCSRCTVRNHPPSISKRDMVADHISNTSRLVGKVSSPSLQTCSPPQPVTRDKVLKAFRGLLGSWYPTPTELFEQMLAISIREPVDTTPNTRRLPPKFGAGPPEIYSPTSAPSRN